MEKVKIMVYNRRVAEPYNGKFLRVWEVWISGHKELWEAGETMEKAVEKLCNSHNIKSYRVEHFQQMEGNPFK